MRVEVLLILQVVFFSPLFKWSCDLGEVTLQFYVSSVWYHGHNNSNYKPLDVKNSK